LRFFCFPLLLLHLRVTLFCFPPSLALNSTLGGEILSIGFRIGTLSPSFLSFDIPALNGDLYPVNPNIVQVGLSFSCCFCFASPNGGSFSQVQGDRYNFTFKAPAGAGAGLRFNMRITSAYVTARPSAGLDLKHVIATSSDSFAYPLPYFTNATIGTLGAAQTSTELRLLNTFSQTIQLGGFFFSNVSAAVKIFYGTASNPFQ
jgi:hypothetical protein